MASLEGWNFTIKLCPRPPKLARGGKLAKFFPRSLAASWEGFHQETSLDYLIILV